MKVTVIILLICLLIVTANGESSMVSAMECSTFCPVFCKGKCGGAEVKATCEGQKCHCGCSATSVGCKNDECEKFCKEHSGNRHYEATCSKPHLCKCDFGDSTKDMNRVNYPIPKDAHYEVVIKPE